MIDANESRDERLVSSLSRVLRRLPSNAGKRKRGLAATAFAIALRRADPFSPRDMYAVLLRAPSVLSIGDILAVIEASTCETDTRSTETSARCAAVFAMLSKHAKLPYPERPAFCSIETDSLNDQDDYDYAYLVTLLEMLPDAFALVVEAIRQWVSRVRDLQVSDWDIYQARSELSQKTYLSTDCDDQHVASLFPSVTDENAKEYAAELHKRRLAQTIDTISHVVTEFTSDAVGTKLLEAAGLLE